MTLDAQLSGIGLVNAAEYLHQRRFTGAVFARQCNDLARADFQIDLIERDHTGESLADSLHLEEMGRSHFSIANGTRKNVSPRRRTAKCKFGVQALAWPPNY